MITQSYNRIKKFDKPTQDWDYYNEFNAIDHVTIDRFEINLANNIRLIKTLKIIIKTKQDIEAQRHVFRFYYF
jgi:hypothetical protein